MEETVTMSQLKSYALTCVVRQVEAHLASSDGLQHKDLRSFWSSRSSQWPHLSSVARDLLGVPASSTSSQRDGTESLSFTGISTST